MMKLHIFLLALLLTISFVPDVFATSSGQIKLVTAVTDGDEILVGTTPDMFLEIRSGSGNVYIDSLPLTRIDTQISTRFANAVACDFLDVDCSRYDFFYKLRTGSNIIGGPSAGGGITVLTIAVLDGKTLNPNIVMTGTINSGGLIGPVGGIAEKAIAANNAGLDKFLIPAIALSNTTTLENISKNLSVEIVPITSLEEALLAFTGTDYSEDLPELKIPEYYTDTMELVANQLCSRFEKISEQKYVASFKGKNDSLYENAQNFYNRSLAANDANDHYSRASFCFSGNLRLRELDLRNMSQEELFEGYEGINNRLNTLEEKTDLRQLNTISDLETYMIVKERISDSRDVLENINVSNISSSRLAYSYERLYSGVYWSEFFGKPGGEYDLHNENLRDVCFEKIEEARERIDYLSVSFSMPTERLSDDLERAGDYFGRGDYGLCLFKASKVKADADVLLTAMIINSDKIDELLAVKFEQTEKVLKKSQKNEMFPILGYSYYEYAKSLKDQDPYSALIYTEYAIELSNLDMYFPPKKQFYFPIPDVSYLWVFALGLAFGGIITVLILNKNKSKKKPKNKKNVKNKKEKPKKVARR